MKPFSPPTRAENTILRQAYVLLSEPQGRDNHFQFINAAVLGWFTLASVWVYFIFGNTTESTATDGLVLFSISILASLGILYFTRFHWCALVTICSAVVMFGFWLVFFYPQADWQTLYWFILLPPMLIFSFGLRSGAVITFGLQLALGICLFWPTPLIFKQNFSFFNAIRFFVEFSCIFCFSCVAEFIRLRTHFSYLQIVELLEEYALTDPLTKLGNRRDFQNYFSLSHAQALRLQQDYSLAIIDLDLFKRVNDKYGHAIGDAVLCHVVATLNSQLRGSDRLFRWGGEEFVLLMPFTSAQDSFTLTNRLRQAVEDTPCILGNITINITISIGLCRGFSNLPMNEQMAIADKNLYVAKANGRNQVCG